MKAYYYAFTIFAALLSLVSSAGAQLFTDPNFATLTGNVNVPPTTTIAPWTYGVTNGSSGAQGQIQKITGGGIATGITIHSNDTSKGLAYAQQTSSSALLANASYKVTFSIKNNGGLQLVGTGAANFTSSIFVGGNGNYVQFTYTFTTGATPGTETIQFQSVEPGGVQGGPNIDLSGVSLAVNTPEPNSLLAATLLLAGICVAERRRLSRTFRRVTLKLADRPGKLPLG